jgi:hypothetical protein
MSELAEYEVLYTVGAPPASADAWRLHVSALAWPVRARLAEVRLPFVGAPGETYYFAARASDRAGNWTPPPTYVQATTRIAGAAPPSRSARVEPIRARRAGVAY